MPDGQNYPEAVQEINVILTELRAYMDNFLAESVMNGIDDKKWEQHLDAVKKFNSERYTQLMQEYYDRMKELMK